MHQCVVHCFRPLYLDNSHITIASRDFTYMGRSDSRNDLASFHVTDHKTLCMIQIWQPCNAAAGRQWSNVFTHFYSWLHTRVPRPVCAWGESAVLLVIKRFCHTTLSLFLVKILHGAYASCSTFSKAGASMTPCRPVLEFFQHDRKTGYVAPPNLVGVSYVSTPNVDILIVSTFCSEH